MSFYWANRWKRCKPRYLPMVFRRKPNKRWMSFVLVSHISNNSCGTYNAKISPYYTITHKSIHSTIIMHRTLAEKYSILHGPKFQGWSKCFRVVNSQIWLVISSSLHTVQQCEIQNKVGVVNKPETFKSSKKIWNILQHQTDGRSQSRHFTYIYQGHTYKKEI